MNDCAERGRGLDSAHLSVDGVELFRSWYASEAYQKHRHDTYAVGVSDSGVQVLDCRGSVRVEDGRHQVGALSILGEVVNAVWPCFGREREPTSPNSPFRLPRLHPGIGSWTCVRCRVSLPLADATCDVNCRRASARMCGGRRAPRISTSCLTPLRGGGRLIERAFQFLTSASTLLQIRGKGRAAD